ncbi:sodium- and chloride-dependent neutral and basic amino acid transporter B(0+)-like isoform X2 [Mauremys mutica]|uniref:sodium- and chloride-dependent neutral and basic amino acid transporter B(0+)-like isoform X2 n=1 Tax=Mauremys mutica TaxID=74926 RepID=UPI001D15F0FA|nr:sodium- and chloride-dependent neutral and basic amino acid transporter B(0+)-like isoform X2 [Mauremys mutica]
MGTLAPPARLCCGRRKDFTLSQGKDAPAGQSEEHSERGHWSSKTDYLLSMLGYAVGLGSIWRFPYLTYKNGGGAFLIPYAAMLALAGLPLFFLECSLGQFASLGPVSVWRILPILQGVGITMVIITTLVTVYYNVIIAYALYYLFASFQSVLPWSDCFAWADENCSTTPVVSDCNTTLPNGIVIHTNYSYVTSNNLTCLNGSLTYKQVQLPSEQYWNKVALRRSSGLDETGEIVWYLALCLLLSWLIVGAALFKGIKSSGKVVYFTALFPYVVLVILLVRGATLEGARNGIEYYIGTQSNFTKLMEAEVWKDAAAQIFFSLSVALGGLVALSSYNKFHNNCYSDAIVVCLVNCLTSAFAGFAIFSVLGHMAFLADRPVSEVVDSGFDLAFVAYPSALSKLPVAPLWSFLFFFMLLLLGLAPQFASIGGNRFIQDIEMMIGKKSWWFWLWWRACWFFVTPVLLCVILCWSLVTFSPPKYGSVEYPAWGSAVGWCMIVFCIIWIPIVAIVKIVKAQGNLWQRIVSCCRPAANWGPSLECHRGERYSHMVDPHKETDQEIPTVDGFVHKLE